jgi:molybdopterin molybdotransferase
LPGNPVIALVCFELFVAPAIRGLMGLPPGPRLVSAELLEDYPYRTDRETYHPCVLNTTGPKLTVTVARWFGSPDLRGVTAANAFVVFPVGDHLHRAGTVFQVLTVD